MVRKIIVKNRISVFSLRPEEIHGVKIIRLVHKLSGDFYNPSSSKSEPLFWKGNVCGEDGSYIDIPESLKQISSMIDPEDIYSLKELSIDGKSVPFKKNIRYMNSDQIAIQISSNKIAEPKSIHHVSYVDGGLCEYDDYYEEVIRSSLEGAVITIEKPENLRVDVNLFAENATLNVLENSPRVYCVEIRGKLTSGNGFSIRWRKVGTLQRVSQKISSDRMRILACVTFVAFLVALTTLLIAQNNIWFSPIVASNIVVAFLALIYAFSPQHAREIIRALKGKSSRLQTNDPVKERRETKSRS